MNIIMCDRSRGGLPMNSIISDSSIEGLPTRKMVPITGQASSFLEIFVCTYVR